MSTVFVYLLIAFAVLFIVSRATGKENRIDAFTKYLGCLACGLFLGAGAYHYFGDDTQPENSVVVATDFTPTHQVDSFIAADNNTNVSQEPVECDTVATETEGDLAQTRCEVEIEDDS